MTTDFDPAAFGAEWHKFIQYVNEHTPTPPPPAPMLVDRLLAFLEADVTSLAIHKEPFLDRDLPNMQRAFDHYLAQPGRFHEQVGYLAEHDQPMGGLSSLLTRYRWQNIIEGPVQYTSVELAGGERLQCVDRGLYLIREGAARLLASMRKNEYHLEGGTLEVACLTAERAEGFIAEIRALAHAHNVYRGRAISLGAKGAEDVRFHDLPAIARDSIILPEALLAAVERNTLDFDAHSARLRAAGRHLKRGLLFHGPPGTGKTLTIMHLLGRMQAQGRTAILLTGRVLGLIRQSCQLARLLAPAVVVLEDVDLVAEERGHGEHTGPLLFELLNEMDGLASDTDVVFILSTNRPDLLEPALTARPGRIDQAVEFPLPDADCRRRLLALYSQGLRVAGEDLEDMAGRTEGTSAAFIRELLRKAALLAAGREARPEGPLTVSGADLREALRSIVVEGGDLTRRLLGVAPGAVPG